MDLQQRHYLARMGKSFANSVRDENLIEARKTARKALNNKAAKYIAEGARGATRRAGLHREFHVPGHWNWTIDPSLTKPIGGPNPYGRSAGGGSQVRPFPSEIAQANKPNWDGPYGQGGGRPIYNGLPSRPGRGFLPGRGLLPGQGNLAGRPAPGSNMRGMGRGFRPTFQSGTRPDAPQTGGYYYQDPRVRPDPRPFNNGLPSRRPPVLPPVFPPPPPSVYNGAANAPRPNAPQTGGYITPGHIVGR